MIPCILPTPHDIELPFLPLTAGFRLIFGVGSLSYVGDVLMQKAYTQDFLTGVRKKNNGEKSMFFIENDHEPIISREDFEAVQRRKNK